MKSTEMVSGSYKHYINVSYYFVVIVSVLRNIEEECILVVLSFRWL